MPRHTLGVACGIAAGAWLGSAEAPTKLVTAGYSPVLISLFMVSGVFVARWTLPTLMKGTAHVFKDIAAKSHIVVWGILAGALWAVANTLTVFAIRNVGLSIAFPLWNTNSLVGIFWGWLLFHELQGAGWKNAGKVIGGAIAIVIAAVILAFASIHGGSQTADRAVPGVLAAFGASLLWGTMYIPYRKAYLSGINPLSFITIFTVGELATMAILALTLGGGVSSVATGIRVLRPAIFWLFLGGFCWVVGDTFQQFATKYIGISRGIPLSNTNQFWGLAWGALVFGELAGAGRTARIEIVSGSVLMILGALFIGSAVSRPGEQTSSREAIRRECDRYGLDYKEALAANDGMPEASPGARSWWDVAIVIVALAIFIWLGVGARRPPLTMQVSWIFGLAAALLVLLLGTGWMLWKQTRFS
jgi:drug/metabolite transporter (DMT)-like permease